MASDPQSKSLLGMLLVGLLGVGYVSTQKAPPEAPPQAGTVPGEKQGTEVQNPLLDRTTLKPYLDFIQGSVGRPQVLGAETYLFRGAQGPPGIAVRGEKGGDSRSLWEALGARNEGPREARPDSRALLAQDPHLRILLATIPDPDHSDLTYDFDQGVQAVEAAFHDMKWYLAGQWIPEQDGDSKGRAPDMPRSLLFVKPFMAAIDPEEGEIPLPWVQAYDKRLVLLLPESPRLGLRRAPLLHAMNLVKGRELGPLSKPGLDRKALQVLHAKRVAETLLGDFLIFVQGLDGADAAERTALREFDTGAQALRERCLAIIDGAGPDIGQDAIRGSLLAGSAPGAGPGLLVLQWSRLPEAKALLAAHAGMGPRLKRLLEPGLRRLQEALWETLGRLDRERAPFLTILGPRYSGSAGDLGWAIRQIWGEERKVLMLSTGSTNESLRGWTFRPNGVPGAEDRSEWKPSLPSFVAFHGLIPDDRAYDAALWETLESCLGQDRRFWAECVESDTLFGSLASGGAFGRESLTPDPGEIRSYPVPSHLAVLRRARADQGEPGGLELGKPLKETLGRIGNLELKGESTGLDRGLHFLNPNSAVDADLSLSNLIQDVKRRHLLGVRIRMSSFSNTLFLATWLRSHLTGASLAMDWTSQLFLHPKLSADLDGVFCIGPMPPYPGLVRGTTGLPSRGSALREPGYWEETTVLTRDALWLLENVVPNGLRPRKHRGLQDWLLLAPELDTRALAWETDPADPGLRTLRHQLWITQLHQGRSEPVRAVLVPPQARGEDFREFPFRVHAFPLSGPVPGGAPPADLGKVQNLPLKVFHPALSQGAIQRLAHALLLGASLAMALGWRTCARLLLGGAPHRECRFSKGGSWLVAWLMALLPLQVLLPLGAQGCLFALLEDRGSLDGLATLSLLAGALGSIGVAGMVFRVSWKFLARTPEFWPGGSRTVSLGILVAVWSGALVYAAILAGRGWLGARGAVDTSAFFLLRRLQMPLTGSGLASLLGLSYLLSFASLVLEAKAFHSIRARGLSLVCLAREGWFEGKGATRWMESLHREVTRPINVCPAGPWPRFAAASGGALLVLGGLLVGVARPEGPAPWGEETFLLLAYLVGSALVAGLGYRAVRIFLKVEGASRLLLTAPFMNGFAIAGKAYGWLPPWGLHWLGERHSLEPLQAVRELAARIGRESGDTRFKAITTRLKVLVGQAQRAASETGHGRPGMACQRSGEVKLALMLDITLRHLVHWAKGMVRQDGDLQGLQALVAYMCLRRALVQVRQALLGMFVITLMLVFIASTPIHDRSLAPALVVVLAVEVALAMVMIARLERNPLFSLVAGTTPGKMDWNSGVVLSLAQPALVLGLGFLLTRFPAAATFFQTLMP
ncbi:hypothetical protein [Mesoterricola silvestris]|uniref:Uncharacterized protein n=1 Tax=Mesoterricola silvestris TaxID=2927979 RepID=A0AA48GTY9_9BACT|nr:hypothetical protein [Mesoterricola silvestris]BDU74012.1 hypothetical protein METEAL_31860 [Mesoterricola silvestris]